MREAHGTRTQPTRSVQVELGGVVATRTARLEEVKVLAIAEETERTRALWGVIGGFGDADYGGVEFDGGAVAGDGVCPPGGLELGGGGGRLGGDEATRGEGVETYPASMGPVHTVDDSIGVFERSGRERSGRCLGGSCCVHGEEQNNV